MISTFLKVVKQFVKRLQSKKVSEQLGEELVIEVSGEEKEVKIKEKKV